MPTHLIVSRRPAGSAPAPALGDFDRLFDSLWRGLGGAPVPGARVRAPLLDCVETASELRVAAELPGLEQSDIEVSLENGVLTMGGERSDAAEDATRSLRHRESFRGRFRRSLRLPAEVDADAVRAVYRNGVLTVTLPKAPPPEVRTIPVTGPESGGPDHSDR